MIGEREVVTICGSMRFFPQMLQVAAELTCRGMIVVAPFAAVPPEGQASRVKRELDQLHLDKIAMADTVVVVSDESGYYGESTGREINYALDLRKEITYRRVPK
jgi:hypothetical protein